VSIEVGGQRVKRGGLRGKEGGLTWAAGKEKGEAGGGPRHGRQAMEKGGLAVTVYG